MQNCFIRLSTVVTLKASVLAARSENGFVHVWNLKTHRVDTALDGHGRKSVYCVETMGGKDRLLRLVKQAKTSEILLVSVMYRIEEVKKKKGISYFWSHWNSLQHIWKCTEVQKYRKTVEQKVEKRIRLIYL